MSTITDAVNANAVSSTSGTTSTSSSSSSSTSAAGTEIGFLKLLTAQLQNQDPTNPVDNAQLTSQIAEINTVDGINKLNTTVSSLSSQFMQMQVMQGTSLLGRDVTVPGNDMTMVSGTGADAGTGTGGYTLTSDATDVTMKVVNAAGSVVDTVDLGAQKAGTQTFTWKPPTGVSATADYKFKISAVNGTNTLSTTALMTDKVVAVNAGGDTLTLQLERLGSTPYASVKVID